MNDEFELPSGNVAVMRGDEVHIVDPHGGGSVEGGKYTVSVADILCIAEWISEHSASPSATSPG